MLNIHRNLFSIFLTIIALHLLLQTIKSIQSIQAITGCASLLATLYHIPSFKMGNSRCVDSDKSEVLCKWNKEIEAELISECFFFEILLDSIDSEWFLYDNGLHLERVKEKLKQQKKIE